LKIFKFFSFFVFKGTGALLTFGYIFLATKILSPTEYGVLALLITFINLGGAFFSFGMPAYFFEILSSKKLMKKFSEKLKYISITIILISIIFCIVVNYYSNLISFWFFKNTEYNFVINTLGLVIFFAILNRIFSSYFIASKKYFVATIGDNFLFPFFIIIFLLISLNLKIVNFDIFLVLILLLLPLITLYYLLYVKINFSFLNIQIVLKKYKETLKPCIDLTVTSISGIILISSDIIILGILSEPALVSNYHIATKISAVISLILAASMSYYYGKSLSLVKKNKISKLSKQFNQVNFYSFVTSLILLIIITLSFNLLIKYFFYNANLDILQKLIFILCFGQFINVIFGYQGSLLIIVPKYRRVVGLIFIFTVIFNIITSIFAFYFFGILGVALVTMTSIILRELLISYFFKKHYNFYPLSYMKKLFV
jgi:O-antigen/teichoic acid export membrane protein